MAVFTRFEVVMVRAARRASSGLAAPFTSTWKTFVTPSPSATICFASCSQTNVMSGVSDPGARLVEAAREAGVSVEVVPGPSAVTAAMAASGVESLGFLFGGFLPARPASARDTALRRLLDASGSTGLPLVLFEAPHRIASLLRALDNVVPEARVAACRELTKLHEEVVVGTPAEVAARLGPVRGELTVVISSLPPPPETSALDLAALVQAAARARLGSRTTVELLRAAGVPRREAYRAVPSRRPRTP